MSYPDKLEYCGIVGVICEHERIHQNDMKELCKKVRECVDNLANLSFNNDLSKVPDKDAKKKCNDPMLRKWMKDCEAWTECNAWTDSLQRFNDLKDKFDCCCDPKGNNHGSPSGDEKSEKCCPIVCNFIKIAERQKRKFCRNARGADGGKCKNAEGIESPVKPPKPLPEGMDPTKPGGGKPAGRPGVPQRPGSPLKPGAGKGMGQGDGRPGGGMGMGKGGTFR